MWVNITGTLTFATVADLATDMYAQYQTHLLPLLDQSSDLQECIVTYYDGAGNPQGSSTATHAGAQTGIVLAANCSTLLSWKIPATWKGGKPRTYLPTQNESNMASIYAWTDAWVGTVETAAAAFLAGVNGITLSGVTRVALGVVSFETKVAGVRVWRTPPVFFEYVAVGVQKRICTQRRRLGALIS